MPERPLFARPAAVQAKVMAILGWKPLPRWVARVCRADPRPARRGGREPVLPAVIAHRPSSGPKHPSQRAL